MLCKRFASALSAKAIGRVGSLALVHASGATATITTTTAPLLSVQKRWLHNAGGFGQSSNAAELEEEGGFGEHGRGGGSGSAANYHAEDAAAEGVELDPEQKLIEELKSMTGGPIQIGHLFKALSKESRDVLGKKKLPLETFLLKHKKDFKLFKPISGPKAIFVCAPHAAPSNAVEGREASAGKLFDESVKESPNEVINQQKIYTVLKYIPNEWSPFACLGIPDDVMEQCIGRKPKAWFEKYPKYFEVKNQSLRAHTFEVRRSLALQQHMAKQQQK